jgi:hypothetical protein
MKNYTATDLQFVYRCPGWYKEEFVSSLEGTELHKMAEEYYEKLHFGAAPRKQQVRPCN